MTRTILSSDQLEELSADAEERSRRDAASLDAEISRQDCSDCPLCRRPLTGSTSFRLWQFGEGYEASEFAGLSGAIAHRECFASMARLDEFVAYVNATSVHTLHVYRDADGKATVDAGGPFT
jgi:hypothetical protein